MRIYCRITDEYNKNEPDALLLMDKFTDTMKKISMKVNSLPEQNSRAIPHNSEGRSTTCIIHPLAKVTDF